MGRTMRDKGDILGPHLVAWIATATTLAAVFGLSVAVGCPWVLPSLGGSCVIAFGMPDSAMARPRSLLGGHLIGAVVGVAFAQLFGDGYLAMAGAVATALTLMQLTDTVHSPAGANPIIVMLVQASWSFVLAPLGLGLLVLLGGTALFNTLAGRRRPKISE
jgi:CBS-domain-containing membrane protein